MVMDTDVLEVAPRKVKVWQHIAVRLADEGVPIKAMARSLMVPYADIIETIKDAKDHGLVLTIPRDDWPIGTRRSDRIPDALQIAMEEPQLALIAGRVFSLGPSIARMFAVMLRRDEMTKDALHRNSQGEAGAKGDGSAIKTVDVHIHKLRTKLKPHDITITTIWGRGYYIPKESKQIAFQIMGLPPPFKGENAL